MNRIPLNMADQPELSDSVHCLLLAQLDDDTPSHTLVDAQELLRSLGTERLVNVCYPISGVSINPEGLYDDVARELDFLVDFYGSCQEVELLV